MSSKTFSLNRRQFLKQSGLAGAGLIIYGCDTKTSLRGTEFKPAGLLGKLSKLDETVPIDRGVWYQAEEVDDGLIYMFETGTLENGRYLTADCLLGGSTLTAFVIILQEGENGPAFSLRFKLLNQCSARIRLPLEALNLNRWCLSREGAWLKPICEGERIDLSRVDRMFFKVLRKAPQPTRWCMAPFTLASENVQTISKPVLPRGRLLDELGQSTIHEWHGKSRSVDYVIKRINLQYENRHSHEAPAYWSRWGGWNARRFKATGFFKTHNDGRRWWLVDPGGHAFWSAGINCFRPDTATNIQGLESALTWHPDKKGTFWQIFSGAHTINYLQANFIRTFGELEWYDKWAEI
ncbi:twin-arginine translocation signal domain-containing protein, partial [candidate division KSB1 bacterium]|nr:twin-arginine translocation signal domain-containing protein [candidate division KSB1 bacterium]